jgi:predicted DNA-binding antitoxin AbrB/MazE fold protein
MSQPIRAIYEDGHLRLLDPVELTEGEEVNVTIQQQPAPPLTDDEKLRAALVSSVRFPRARREDDDFDEEAAMRLIDEQLRAAGYPSASEYIIQERREGP